MESSTAPHCVNTINEYLTLSKLLNTPGSGIYSHYRTLSKGRYYLLGTNPGGTPDTSHKKSIGYHLHHTGTTNNLLEDPEWETGAGNRMREKIKTLFLSIHQQLENICASNLIWECSNNLDNINNREFNQLAKQYWPVHQAIIQTVNPDILIVFGSGNGKSPYSYLKQLINPINQLPDIQNGTTTSYFKGFTGWLEGRHRGIIAIPHPSKFNVPSNLFSEMLNNITKQLAP